MGGKEAESNLSYIFMENKWPDYLFIYSDIRCLEKSLSLSLELWMYAKKCQQFASTYDTNKTVVRPMDCRDSEIWPTSRLSLRELQYKTIYLYMYRKKNAQVHYDSCPCNIGMVKSEIRTQNRKIEPRGLVRYL